VQGGNSCSRRGYLYARQAQSRCSVSSGRSRSSHDGLDYPSRAIKISEPPLEIDSGGLIPDFAAEIVVSSTALREEFASDLRHFIDEFKADGVAEMCAK